MNKEGQANEHWLQWLAYTSIESLLEVGGKLAESFGPARLREALHDADSIAIGSTPRSAGRSKSIF